MQGQAFINRPERDQLDSSSGLSIVEVSGQSCVTQNRTRIQSGRPSLRWRKCVLWKQITKIEIKSVLLKVKFVAVKTWSRGLVVKGEDLQPRGGRFESWVRH